MYDFAPHDLTSDTSRSPYVISASSFFTGLDPWKAFEGTPNAYWVGTGSGVDWLAIDSGAGITQILLSYSIQVNVVPEASRAPKDWTAEGSTDGVTWHVVDTVTGQTAWTSGERRTFTCDVTTTAYRHFRVNITANNGDSTYTQIAELQLFSATGPGELVRSGWTASATNSSGSETPDLAIDSNEGTEWVASSVPVDFIVDMGSPRIFNYIIWETPGFIPLNPGQVEFYVSSDGTNWGAALITAIWPYTGFAAITNSVVFPTQTKQWIKVHVITRAPGPFASGPGCAELRVGLDPNKVGTLWASMLPPPEGTVGAHYSHGMTIGQGATPYTVAVHSGALPAGLAVDNAGLISGIPAAGGTFAFTLRVTDSAGAFADVAGSVHIFRAGAPTGGAAIVGVKLVAWSRGVQTGSYAAFLNINFSIDGADSGFLFPGGALVASRQGTYSKVSDEMNITLPAPDLTLCTVWVGIIGTTFGVGQLNELFFYGCYLQADYDDGTRQYSYPTVATAWQGDQPPELSGVDNPGNAADTSMNTAARVWRLNYSGLSVPDYLHISGFGPFLPAPPVPPTPPAPDTSNWLDLWVWRTLKTFVATDQDIQFPPGYERAMRLQLAVEFARQYPGHDLTRVRKQLAQAIEAIDRINVSNSQAIEDLPEPAE